MRGTMMDFPLTLTTLLERAGKLFSKIEIVSRRPDRSLHRTTYGEFYRRARNLAAALTKAGLERGDYRRRAARLPRSQICEVAVAGRLRVRQRNPPHFRRQVPEDQAARTVRQLGVGVSRSRPQAPHFALIRYDSWR